ncbi:MAG: tRNA (adenosine(37)-N6)-threonylcarbamoyltransferase complex transferase subunit TsaD [Flavobacteriaceae bacterium]
MPIILGIESSCDDTAAAVLQDGSILSNVIANQRVHEQFGGVVPELAARAHLQNIVPVVDQALAQANIAKKDIHAVAYTLGPGLVGSLLVGNSFAKSLALSLGVPLIEVNHMQAHLLVHFEKDLPKPKFPFLGLTVSGGHTQLVIVRNVDDMEIIGETLDDAVGEAFDKAGKMLGLPYPSGPAIDRLAREGKACVEFAKPSVSALNFSFSGLKTSILYHLRDKHQEDDKYIKKNLNDLCASIQSTIVSIVMEKLELAVQQTGITEVALGGGVSANSGLRNALMNKKKWNIYLPPLSLTTDNAAMIALAGSFKYENGNYGQLDSHAQSRMPL